MLVLTYVPEMVSTDKIYRLQYSDSFSGDIFMRANNGPFVSLEHAFHRIFSNSLLNYKITLFTIGASTVEICRPFPEVFKIFDSHSKDVYEMPCSSGSCILTSVEDVENLVKYFQLTSCTQNHFTFRNERCCM